MPLGQRVGLGTVANAIVIGLGIDVVLAVLGPASGSLAVRLAEVAATIALGGTIGVGTLAFALLVVPAVQLALGRLGARDAADL